MKITQLKKYVLGVASLLILMASCSTKPEGYTINGVTDKDLGVDSIFIYENINNKLVKRNGTALKDGKFTLKGATDTIKTVYVGNVDKDAFVNLILENDTFEVTLSDKEIKVEGGNINTMVLGYFNDKEYVALGNRNFELNMKAIDEEDEEVKANLIKEIRKVQNEMFILEDNALYKVIDDAKNPAIGRLLALIRCENFEHYDMSKRRALVAEIETNLDPKYSKIAKDYIVSLGEMEKAQKMSASVGNGKQFKPVSGVNVKGKELLLKDFISKNKYTLLEFWASWCSPCRAEIPVLKQAYKKYKNKGFEIFSFSIDEDKASWKKALKEEKTTWIQTLKQGKKGEEVIASYGVQGIPASFLIDQNGKIVASNDELRGSNLEKLLSKILK